MVWQSCTLQIVYIHKQKQIPLLLEHDDLTDRSPSSVLSDSYDALTVVKKEQTTYTT